MEHHSNMIPWQLLAREKGATLKFIPVREDGTLDLDVYRNLLDPRVKLVSVTHMSNVLGTINPIKEMTALAHRAGALMMVDAAQSVPHLPVDVQNLDCDFLAFSGHKMCGPTGIGVLYGKPEILETMDPFMGGGEMILKVFWDHATWAEVPHKFEPGTPPIAEAFGLGAAVDYLAGLGMDALQAHEKKLTRYALERLKEVPGLRIFGAAPDRGGAISFELPGIHAHDVAQFVDREGVAIRAGHHCAQPLMRKLGVPATGRASLYLYNLESEIDQLVAALIKTREFFNHGS
jgi:cysteine desulfurase/selenocysteine lyase